ncbi:VOC family protein [Frigoribacterium salinisoli]
MGLRWYSVVVDCSDLHAQARWWAETLGWQLVFEADDEAAVVPPHAVDDGRDIPLDEQPQGLVFVPVPEGKTVKNRLHIDLAPGPDDDQAEQVAALVARGATRVDVGQGDETWVVLADPEGNEFCVLSPRD